MAVITLSNIKKSYGPRVLFDNVSFFINERERVALIGANGTGKTTLLRIICDEESRDSGSISKEPGISVGYLPQEVDLPGDIPLHLAVMGVTPQLLACATALSELEKKMATATGDEAHEIGTKYAEASHDFDTLHGFDYQIRARAILLGLGFAESEFENPVCNLSGGQKTRAALARLLLLAPDLLLLDEPTNHLDIQACDWLQAFLQDRYQGAVLLVSHDRYFMDKVISRVVELEDQTIYSYPGNYSEFARQKAEKIEEQRKLYKAQQKEISRIEAAIQTLFSDRKFSRRDNKVKQLNRIVKVSNIHEKGGITANLTSAVRSGREVVRLCELKKSFPGKDLFSEVDFLVERGRKLGIVGPNGSGKTTMLKIIAGREPADSGEVMFGHNVHPVYFAQEFDHLVPNHTVLEELLADADLTSGQARDLLAQFLFIGDDAFKKVEVLSGGELCRLSLAKVLANKPNLLLLDEPTNHLDIRSREALEDALKNFDGTVLVCSHDRYLLDAITNEIFEIKEGGWATYLGNYSDYKQKTHPEPEQITSTPIKGKAAVVQEEPKKRTVSNLREKERLIKELTRKGKTLEQEIGETEERIHTLAAALVDEENYKNGTVKDLTAEYDELSTKLDSLYADWEQVCDQLKEEETALEELK